MFNTLVKQNPFSFFSNNQFQKPQSETAGSIALFTPTTSVSSSTSVETAGSVGFSGGSVGLSGATSTPSTGCSFSVAA